MLSASIQKLPVLNTRTIERLASGGDGRWVSRSGDPTVAKTPCERRYVRPTIKRKEGCRPAEGEESLEGFTVRDRMKGSSSKTVVVV